MSDPRVVKVTFAITGEIEIFDHGDNYVTFSSQDEMKRYDKKHAKRIIERNIKNKGLEAYEYRIQTKSRDMTEKDFPPMREPVSNEPPF